MEGRKKQRVRTGSQEERREDGGVRAGRVSGVFCKDERKVRVCLYGMRWSALILSLRVRSRHDPPSRPYICILPLNRQAACKERTDGGRQRGSECVYAKEGRLRYGDTTARNGEFCLFEICADF